jgi:hypothetical protein
VIKVQKKIDDDVLMGAHCQDYPLYLERFSELYANLENAPMCADNPMLMHAGWNFAIYTQALTSKEFLIAYDFLKRVRRALARFVSDIDPQLSTYAAADKLYQFTIKLQKHYEEFLQKKKIKKVL